MKRKLISQFFKHAFILGVCLSTLNFTLNAQFDQCFSSPPECRPSKAGNGPDVSAAKLFCSDSGAVEHGMITCTPAADTDGCGVKPNAFVRKCSDYSLLSQQNCFHATNYDYVQWIKFATPPEVNAMELQAVGKVDAWALYYAGDADLTGIGTAGDYMAAYNDYTNLEPVSNACGDANQWKTWTHPSATMDKDVINIYYIALLYKTPSKGFININVKECGSICVPPKITCPLNQTVDCDESIHPDHLVYPTHSSGCGTINYTFNDAYNTYDTYASNDIYDNNICPTNITRTWTATDKNGQTDNCNQTITIEDTTPPVMTCPDDLTVQCEEDIPHCNSEDATVTDNCDDIIDISCASGHLVDGTCGGTVTVTFTAEDDCGNYADCYQTITVNDTEAPTIAFNSNASELLGIDYTPTSGSEFFVQCGNVPIFNDNFKQYVDVSDNCSSTTTTFSDILLGSGECDIDGYIKKFKCEWTATDECENYTSIYFFITVKDTEAPKITCPDDLTVECEENIPHCNSEDATATDNCDNNIDFFCSSGDLVSGTCGGTVTVTFIAEDDCGNYADCYQTITVNDTEAPQITCPDDLTVQCEEDIPSCDIAHITATDNCDEHLEISCDTDDLVSGPCGGTVTVTFIAEDDCGNYADCYQTITVNDTEVPTITFNSNASELLDIDDTPTSGSEFFVQCGNVPIFNDNFKQYVDVSDNCSSTTITFSDILLGNGECDIDGYIKKFKCVWTATDECENYTSIYFFITIQDTEAPKITCPDDLTVQCEEDIPHCNSEDATATDNCDNNLEISCSSGHLVSGTCGGTVTVTFIAEDNCGNYADCYQTITVNDTEDPTIAFNSNASELLDIDYTPTSGSEFFVQCGEVPRFNDNFKQYVDVSDNCYATTTTFSDILLGSGECDIDGYIKKFKCIWTATDECENYTSIYFFITVQDTEAPKITCPDDLTVQCEADIPSCDNAHVTATDNCDEHLEISCNTDDLVSGPCSGTVTVTFIAQDDCGNYADCYQTITVSDTEAPQITCPDDLTVQCEADIPSCDDAHVTTTDNCDEHLEISCDTDDLVSGPCGGTLTVTFIAQDDCGNYADCYQTITVNDTEAPQITCPDDLTVQCEADIPICDNSDATATDNCDEHIDISCAAGYFVGDMCNGSVTVTFTAEDDCGNYADCYQTITVKDTYAPTIAFNSNVSDLFGIKYTPTSGSEFFVQCDNVPIITDNFTQYVDASDNCSSTTVTFTDILLGNGECDTDGYVEKLKCVWTATDECGKHTSINFYITIVDHHPPVLTCPVDATVDSPMDVPDPIDVWAMITAEDNCDHDITIELTDDTGPTVCENGTFSRTYSFTATDDCGNTDICHITYSGSCGSVCTLTQGAWGNAGGNYPYNGGTATTTELISTLMSTNGPVVIGSGGNTLTVQSPQCVIELLPSAGGGPNVSGPRPLANGNYIASPSNGCDAGANNQNKGGRLQNNLATQTIALTLSIWYSNSSHQSLACVAGSDDYGTMGDLLAAANACLGDPHCSNAGELTGAIGAANEYWDECEIAYPCNVYSRLGNESDVFNSEAAIKTRIKDLPMQVELYPNPATAIIELSISIPTVTDAQIQIVDINGQIKTSRIYSQLKGQQNEVLDISTLPPGIYYIMITTTDGISETRKFVKINEE